MKKVALIADLEETNVALYRKFLEEMFNIVYTVKNIKELFNVLEKVDVKLILFDTDFPKIKLLHQHLKDDSRIKAIGLYSYKHDGFDLPKKNFLRIPIRKENLIGKIKEIFQA